MRRLAVLSAIFVCTVCAPSYADGDDQNPPGQQPTTAAPTPKEPPPPLFPRHRRGIYRNSQGLEVVDATPQSPPLETDDPNVPDPGEWEINLTTFADLAKESQRVDLLFVDANYGMLPKIAGHTVPTQLKMEFPLSAARTNGDSFTFGVGAVKLGLKFTFYTNEHKGLLFAVYPQVAFAAPGQTLILPLMVSKEFHHFTFVANGGVEKPVHDPEREIAGTLSVGFGRAITRRLAAMIEVRGESPFVSGGDRLMFLNVGLIRGIHNVVLYARVGHSLASSDDVSHTYFGFGLKLRVQSDGSK